MFRGNHPARVDEKGRLKMPSAFKDLLVVAEDEKKQSKKEEKQEEKKQLFYITSKDGKRAEIWPMAAWEQVEVKLAAISNLNPAKRKFLDVTSYYGQVAEMDNQGRLLVPQVLREAAKLGDKVADDVVVLGKQSYLEVVNLVVFQAEMSADPLTAIDLAELASFDV